MAGSVFLRLALLAMMAGLGVAHASGLATFAPPANGYFTKDGNFTATLVLTGTANPRTLKVTSGNTDVTYLFNPGSCAQAPCTLTARLTPNAGVLPGQNYLTAKVRGANSAVDIARQRFSYQFGLGDPTTGPDPGHLVRIDQTDSTITVKRFPKDPTSDTILTACDSPQVRIADFDRMTLQLKSNDCVLPGAVSGSLSNKTEADLIIVSAPWGTTYNESTVDLTAIGVSDDLKNKAAYYAVGYGGAAPGVAFQAVQESGDDGTHPKTVRGNLVNLGCLDTIPVCGSKPNASFYTFQPTNAMGFAIVPGAAGTPGNPGLPIIYVGNPSIIGSADAPPKQQKPQNSNTKESLFSNKTYSPQWTGGSAAGGVYLVILNRSDLTLYSETLYVTNCGCASHTNDNTQIQKLADALNDHDSERLFLLTTVGIPFQTNSATVPLLLAVNSLGVTTYALQTVIPDFVGAVPRAGFSMVSYNNRPKDEILKRYSSAGNVQQGETGALKGVFAKTKTAYYETQNLRPFDVASLPLYPTANDYLKDSLSAVIGSTEPTDWPEMGDTKTDAYSYLSHQLIQNNLATSGECGVHCYDVRFYYTGTDATTIYSKLQPKDVPYPSDNKTFSQTDFAAVQQQLQLESIYLLEVAAFEAYTKQMNTSSSLNVGSALRAAGATITNVLQNVLGVPAQDTAESSAKIAVDVLNTVAAVVSMGGVANKLAPPAALISGVLLTATGITTDVLDAQKTKATPDPYVTQLQQLTQEDTEKEESAATKFSNDLATSTGVFYNGVYSDWFRLQSVALLTQDQTYGGWFLADKDKPNDAYLHSLQANARIQLWQQILRQRFRKAAYNGVATGYYYQTEGTDVGDTFHNFLKRYDGPQSSTTNPNDLHFYSWINRPTGGQSTCEDYTIIFAKDRWNTTWPDAFGTMLFSKGDNTDGLAGPLNLDRNFVYDAQIDWWNTGVQYPQPVTDQTKGNINTSWRCDAYGSSGDENTPKFSDLTPSQSVVEGSGVINVLGKILQGTRVPPGNVTISVGGITVSAPIGNAPSPGSFSASLDVTSLLASSQPYTITYHYAGAGPQPNDQLGFWPTSDVSTALTINSPNTKTELSAGGSGGTYPGVPDLKVTVSSPAGTPTGTVHLLNNGNEFGTASLVGGQAPFNKTALDVGTYVVSAWYQGESPYQSSTSNTIQFTITKAIAMPRVSLSNNPIGFATPTVTISGNIGFASANIPAGYDALTITINGVKQITHLNTFGDFSINFPTASIPVGSYSVTLDYDGAPNFNSVHYKDLQLTIAQIKPVFSNLTPNQTITAGTPSIQLAGNLQQSGAIPTGLVSIMINSKTVDVQLQSNGDFSTTFDTSDIPAAVNWYTITYKYQGDANFGDNGDSRTFLIVQPNTTTITLSSSANPSVAGQPVTFTAKVTSSTGTPTGTVAFSDGNTALGPGTLDPSGTATYTTSSLSVGQHSITALYTASGVFANSPVASLIQTVNKATPAFSGLTASQTIGYYTPNVTLQGTLSVGASTFPAAGEQVTITIGSQKQNATIGVNGAFSISFPTQSLNVGKYPIQYSYAGSSTLAATMPDPSTDLTIAQIKPVFSNLTPNQTITAGTPSIQLAGNLQQSGAIPTGLVSIMINSKTVNVQLQSNGDFSTTFDTSDIPAAVNWYTITYKYQGDANFSDNGDSRTFLIVQPNTTTTTLSSSANPSVAGQPVTFTAKVTSSTGTPTGTVAFSDNGMPLGTGTLTNGSTTYTTSSLLPGNHPITALYTASGVFANSPVASLSQTVKANASFSNLTSPVATAGAASVAFPGVLSAAGPTYPDGSTAVIVTIAPGLPNQIQASGKPSPDGSFSIPVNVSSLAAGTYAVQYDYAGDAKLSTAKNTNTTLTIQSAGPLRPTVVLSASPNPVVQGQSIVFTATVS